MNTVEKMAVINPVQEAGSAPAAVSTDLVGNGNLMLEFWMGTGRSRCATSFGGNFGGSRRVRIT